MSPIRTTTTLTALTAVFLLVVGGYGVAAFAKGSPPRQGAVIRFYRRATPPLLRPPRIISPSQASTQPQIPRLTPPVVSREATAGKTLPFTGVNLGWMALGGALLVFVGLVIRELGRDNQPR